LGLVQAIALRPLAFPEFGRFYSADFPTGTPMKSAASTGFATSASSSPLSRVDESSSGAVLIKTKRTHVKHHSRNLSQKRRFLRANLAERLLQHLSSALFRIGSEGSPLYKRGLKTKAEIPGKIDPNRLFEFGHECIDERPAERLCIKSRNMGFWQKLFDQP